MKIDIKDLSPPKVILFDWDGTLVNTNGIYKNLLRTTIKELGIDEWDREAEEKYRFYSRRHALPMIFGDRWEEVNTHYLKKIREISNGEIIPFENSLNLLQYFFENEIQMSIVSNKEGAHLREEVNSLGWNQYFHKIIGAADAKRDKPWPDPVHMALEGRDVEHYNDIWFLGDSLVDMQCARAVGCVPILITAEGHSNVPTEYLTFKHMHVHDHDELVQKHRQLK